MISLNQDFAKEDMPIAATFVSPVKRLKICIEPSEHYTGADGTPQKVPKVGFWVEFENGRKEIKNRAVLDALLKHPEFNVGQSGFFVDETDYTGFWRSQGVIETREIKVAVAQADGAYHIDPAQIDMEKAAAVVPGKVEPLQTAQRF